MIGLHLGETRPASLNKELQHKKMARFRVLMLQCVLTRGAQEAYSAVCGEDGLDYEAVKAAALKACELVAEAIRDLNSHFPLNSPQLLKSILLRVFVS